MKRYQVQDEKGDWHDVTPMQYASYKADGANCRVIDA